MERVKPPVGTYVVIYFKQNDKSLGNPITGVGIGYYENVKAREAAIM